MALDAGSIYVTALKNRHALEMQALQIMGVRSNSSTLL